MITHIVSYWLFSPCCVEHQDEFIFERVAVAYSRDYNEVGRAQIKGGARSHEYLVLCTLFVQVFVRMYIKFEPRRKKTDFQGLHPGSTRTGLYRDRRSPPKNSIYQVRDCSYYICIKQIKISCAVRITSPCDLYPLTPHLYIYSGIHYFLFFFALNRDCGYSLEPPHVYPRSMF